MYFSSGKVGDDEDQEAVQGVSQGGCEFGRPSAGKNEADGVEALALAEEEGERGVLSG